MVQDAFTLKGKTLAITRPLDQAKETGNLIKRYNGKPYFIPTISIKPNCDHIAVQSFVSELGKSKIDYAIFMSPNGIRQLLNCTKKLGLTVQLLENLRKTTVVAVGPKTAEELKVKALAVDLIPEKYSSSGIIQCLEHRGVFGKSIYIPRTSNANPNLKNSLKTLGANVHELYVYESILPANEQLNQKFLNELKRGKINAIIFGSSLSAKNLFEMLSKLISEKELKEVLNDKLDIVAIGPVTAKTLVELGLKVDVMPDRYLFEEAIKKLAQYWTDAIKP